MIKLRFDSVLIDNLNKAFNPFIAGEAIDSSTSNNNEDINDSNNMIISKTNITDEDDSIQVVAIIKKM